MSDPELMELVRLQIGDVLTQYNWRIDEIHQAPAPGQMLQTDEIGRWVDNKYPKSVTRLKFTCTTGAWYGYLFPETGRYVNIHNNGASESVRGGGKVDLVQLVQKRQPNLSRPYFPFPSRALNGIKD